MPYQVLENGKPCDSQNFEVPTRNGWDESKFDNSAQAIIYARRWAGKFAPSNMVKELMNNRKVQLSTGDWLEIKEI